MRARAWKSLEGTYWDLFLLSLIVVVIAGAAGSFTMGALSLLALPMTFALEVAFLVASRQKAAPKVETLFTVYRDNFKNAFLIPLLVGLFTYLWTLLFVIPGIIMGYAYSMAIFVSKDHPELTPMEAIRKSKELMRGHKWDLFVLDLSFIGWILLCILTCGLGIFFLLPYVEMAHAEFYREITEQVEEAQVVNE